MKYEGWRGCESSDNLVPSEKVLSILTSDCRDMCKGGLSSCASSADIISLEILFSKSFPLKIFYRYPCRALCMRIFPSYSKSKTFGCFKRKLRLKLLPKTSRENARPKNSRDYRRVYKSLPTAHSKPRRARPHT